MAEDVQRFNLILPDDVHVDLKKKCAEDHVSMSEKVRQLVSDYLAKENDKKPTFKGMRTNKESTKNA